MESKSAKTKEGDTEMNTDTTRDKIYNMVFILTDGYASCPIDILDLAINRYGEDTVYKEMLKAGEWLRSYKAKHKRRRVSGLGLFLLNWFESSEHFRLRDAEKKQNSFNRWED